MGIFRFLISVSISKITDAVKLESRNQKQIYFSFENTSNFFSTEKKPLLLKHTGNN